MRSFLQRATPYVFLAPAAAITFVALLYPMLRSIWLSFHEWSIGTPPGSAVFVGLANYRWLLNDDAFWISVGVTLAFAGRWSALRFCSGWRWRWFWIGICAA